MRVLLSGLVVAALAAALAVVPAVLPMAAATATEADNAQISSATASTEYVPFHDQVEQLIYGGFDAVNPGWIVALFNHGNFHCTGSLVDTQVVLTAAHCVDDPGEYSVLVGEEYLYANGTTRSVTQIHINPGWGGNFNDTDLALLALSAPVTNETIATLNTTGLWPEWTQNLSVAGWGQSFTGSPPSSYLQAADVFATSGMDGTIDPVYCDLPSSAATIGGMFCFGGPVAAGPCPGDSGGPVIGWPTPSSSSGTVVIYGLVSYGPAGCGSGGSDSAAQSVGGHHTWIQSVIASIKNRPFIANDDGPFDIGWNGTLSLPAPGVLGNDVDPHGAGMVAKLASGPAHGKVTLNADGSFTYTHNGDSATSDSFTYKADAPGGGANSNVATVTLGIAAKPEPTHSVGLVDSSQGQWHLYDSERPLDASFLEGLATSFFFGNPGDYPIMGDWDGDGIETPGMYRQSDGFVYLRNSNTQGNADIKFFFGNPGDVPIAGDFNNDGFDTVSIYRPAEARFYIINELGENDGGLGPAEFSYVFGDPGDKPFVGDFDGDGIETVGLHRESTGLVYFRNSHTQGNADVLFIFGDPGDRLIAGDWTGGEVYTPALYRPSNTTVYFKYTNTTGPADNQFSPGPSGPTWLPVAGYTGL